MIAKVYYLVGTVYVNWEAYGSSYAFPTKVFGCDEEASAIREYDRLAKHNAEDQSGYTEAYVIKMRGEEKTIIRGTPNKIDPFVI